MNIDGYACPDEFYPMDILQNTFLISMMCNDQGGSPGMMIQLHLPTGEYSHWQVRITIINKKKKSNLIFYLIARCWIGKLQSTWVNQPSFNSKKNIIFIPLTNKKKKPQQ